MEENPQLVNDSVVEFLDLARLDSPYTPDLLSQHRARLVEKMLKSNRIDQATADYLLS